MLLALPAGMHDANIAATTSPALIVTDAIFDALLKQKQSWK